MMFKNSFKLFCSNFDKVWKLLLFYIVVFGVVIGLLAPFFDIFKEVIAISWTDDILSKLPSTGLLYGSDVAGLFSAVCNFCLSFVVTLFTKYIGVGIYFVIIVCFVLPFLLNVGKYVINEMLYNYMSSQTKVGFFSAFIKTLRKSTAYAALKTLYSLVLSAIAIAFIFGIVAVEAPYYNFFLPIIVIVGLSFICAILQTFVSGWAPASVVYGFNVAKSYNIGIRAVFRRYARVLSTSFIINMIFTFLVLGFGIVSAVVFVPLYLGLNNMFEMVMFFGSQGMRYYADADTVLSPKKLEQLDNIQQTKYLL